MGIFSRWKQEGFMDAIRCDEPSYLIWKWHPQGTAPGESLRENSIRMGSSLRVKEGEVAVFLYTQEGKTVQEFIAGPYDATVDTENIPAIADILGPVYHNGTPFPAEVYFINLAQIIQTRFAVPFFTVYDPRFANFGVPVAVRGTITFRIGEYRQFIRLHRLRNFSMEDFQHQIRDVVSRYVKDTVANAPAANNIPVVQLESRISQINDVVEYDLKTRLEEDFGIAVQAVDIGAIEIDHSSEEYTRLMAVTRAAEAKLVYARTTTAAEGIRARQRADAAHYEETLRIQREEAQYAQRKQTETANFAAYQVEKQAEVGTAGAQALGSVPASGGSEPGSVNMASMMAGMAVGGAVGQNLAGAVSGAMAGFGGGAVPPPIPEAMYYVARNGHAAGPYDRETLRKMAGEGQLMAETLVWSAGMSGWAAAGTVESLKNCLGPVIPPIPGK